MSLVAARLGAVVSRTVTLNVFVVVLPDASRAVQVTVVVPRGNAVPLGGTQATAGAASQTSVTAGVANVTTVPARSFCSTVMSLTASSVGAVVSRTVTLNVFVAVLPDASRAVQ